MNGTAVVSADPAVTTQFEQRDKNPKVVIITTIGEMYFQCAKALMRSELWTSPDVSDSVPTAGQFLKGVTDDFDAKSYDEGYPEYAKTKMW